ncbi:zinc-dependent alcohol dehydrogenase [Cytobacillus oceanisediminis]|uniref:zinc-dependent alcohol dehydrogenase n=1 Tax=Cytobacillus oceanisediminis TaxID=665099 RepID=UPI003734EB58
MKALMKLQSGVGNVSLAEVPEPSCDETSVKIKVAYTGICGTDLHIYHDTFKSSPPVIMGHEFSGVISEVGKSTNGFKAGDRVTVLPSSAGVCQKCSNCKKGYYMLCADRKGMGLRMNGSFTKYAVVPDEVVYKIPDHISLEEAALTEPLAVAVHSIEELTSINLGDTVLVSGPGPIGLVCTAVLAAKGCKVIVAGTTIDQKRLEIAKEVGAYMAVDVLKEDLIELIAEETGKKGADAAIECAGSASSVANCLNSLKKKGKLIQAGIVGKEIMIDYDLIHYKEISVYGSLGHTLATWDRVMETVSSGKVNLQPIITHKLPLSGWKAAFELCEQKQAGKVLLYHEND